MKQTRLPHISIFSRILPEQYFDSGTMAGGVTKALALTEFYGSPSR